LAQHYQNTKQFDKAEETYQAILTIVPGWAEAHSNLGVAMQKQGKLTAAAAGHARAVTLKPKCAELHYKMGSVFQEMGRLTEAAAWYRQALELEPEHAQAHNHLGTVLLEEGDLDAAAAQYERALALKPDYAAAHYNRSRLRTFCAADAELAALEALAARVDSLPESARPCVHFALAKALDDVGDYARAFAQLLAGNAMKRREIDYDEARTHETFRLIAETFNTDLLDRLQGTGEPTRAPIFIVGMPRSGSTLIEQILASHPDVHGAGELGSLNRIAISRLAPYPAYVSGIEADGWRRMGDEYLKSLPEMPQGKKRFTDKSPLNFLHVGLIRLALPHARIIHTVRNPVDTCFSCFSKLFTFEMKFSYNLGELGRYYRYYRELMAHWRSVLPPDAMLDVSYESVVANLEEQIRRMLDYCGLPWDDGCLEFYKTRRPVLTASANQVRRPLFRSSINRWRRYQDYLQPLLSELEMST